MAKRKPSYRLHKPSGQAIVTLSGKMHYLGEHNSPASLQAYERLIAEWEIRERQAEEVQRLDVRSIDRGFFRACPEVLPQKWACNG